MHIKLDLSSFVVIQNTHVCLSVLQAVHSLRTTVGTALSTLKTLCMRSTPCQG